MKKIIAVLIAAVLFVTAVPIQCFAANACPQISGSMGAKVKFKVETGKRLLASDKLVLNGAKGSFYREGLKTTVKKSYGCYNVSIVNKDTGKTIQKVWTGKSLTIKLAKNSTYEITVTPVKDTVDLCHYISWLFDGWKTYPTWSVSRTAGIKLCK